MPIMYILERKEGVEECPEVTGYLGNIVNRGLSIVVMLYFSKNAIIESCLTERGQSDVAISKIVKETQNIFSKLSINYHNKANGLYKCIRYLAGSAGLRYLAPVGTHLAGAPWSFECKYDII